jgi:hypothetical protein
VYAIVNRFAPGIPAQVVALCAVGVGSAAFVYWGSVIAPRFSRSVAYTLAISVLTAATYYVVVVALNGFGSPPLWYAVLIGVVAAAGAVYGCVASRKHSAEVAERDFYAWMPDALRWCAFIPVGFVLSLLCGYALGLPLSLLRFSSELIPLINTPVMTAAFLGIAVAIAPRHKKTVGLTLGSLTALVIILLLWSALSRAVNEQMLPLLAYQKPDERALSTIAWNEILTAISTLIGLVIAAVPLFE